MSIKALYTISTESLTGSVSAIASGLSEYAKAHTDNRETRDLERGYEREERIKSVLDKYSMDCNNLEEIEASLQVVKSHQKKLLEILREE